MTQAEDIMKCQCTVTSLALEHPTHPKCFKGICKCASTRLAYHRVAGGECAHHCSVLPRILPKLLHAEWAWCACLLLVQWQVVRIHPPTFPGKCSVHDPGHHCHAERAHILVPHWTSYIVSTEDNLPYKMVFSCAPLEYR